ncbi:MAG: hypothetical protein KAT32_04405 [Candidatus Moranbacteria bacterium]|nr:hypothetical protein [Candidatus Moranbacteria bacterium]
MKKNKTNFYTFIIAGILIISSLTFFTFAEDENQRGFFDGEKKSIFEDFDGDGLSNSEEKSFGTDMNNRDSDGDGYSDGVEIESGYDPLIPAPGDRIIEDKKMRVELDPATIDDKNLTQKLSNELVEYIGDAQESGEDEISTEDLSEMVSGSVSESVSFENIEIDLSELNIKEQDYKKLSEKKRKAKEKEDAIEYFTSVSYVFMTNFPDGFFDKSAEEFASEVLMNSKSFSADLTNTQFFEDLAENAIKAEEEMKNVEVPESLVEIHFRGLYILCYIRTIYSGKEYENAESDAVSMIVTLTKLQGLLELSNDFFGSIDVVMEEYEIEDSFLSF